MVLGYLKLKVKNNIGKWRANKETKGKWFYRGKMLRDRFLNGVTLFEILSQETIGKWKVNEETKGKWFYRNSRWGEM